MSGIFKFPASMDIKSVQRGRIALSTSANNTSITISAVNTGTTELRRLGLSSASTNLPAVSVDIALTNSTTITAARTGSLDAATLSWELTEYYP